VQRGADVVDEVRDVVHPRAALCDEAPDGRVLTGGGEELDAFGADEHRGRLDPLVGERLPVLQRAAEDADVRRERPVEVVDCDADVMDAERSHAADATSPPLRDAARAHRR